MPSISEAWPVLKAILEVGAVGALLVLMVWFFRGASKDLKACLEKRVQDEKDHSKELMRLQTEHNKELVGVVRQYDETLTSVNATLDSLVEEMKE